MEKTGLKHIDELVRRAIIGDGAAFTELWDTNIESLKAYLASTVMKQYDTFYIDDICSRSFEKAFRQIGSYDPSRSQFSTWLKAIARNTALDTLEAEERTNRKFVSIDEGSARVAVLDNMGDGESTPLESIIRDEDEEKLSPLNIIKRERRGRLMTFTIRGNQGEIKSVMESADPVFYELIPLSLEEIFISETEVAGYDVKKIIFGE